MVHVQHLGAVLEQDAFGEAGRSARVHEHDRVVFVGLVGDHGRAGLDQVFISKVVRHVAIADQHDMAERQVGTDVGDVAGEVIGEHGVDEDHLGAGVGQDRLQLPAGKAQVERCDDATAEERRRGTARGTRGRCTP